LVVEALSVSLGFTQAVDGALEFSERKEHHAKVKPDVDGLFT
jgi:hypothetical protein